jgi:hypothetical protein
VTWFLHAVEQGDGRWLPRFGREEFDAMPDEASVLAFLVSLAMDRGGRDEFRLYLHRLDGTVESRPATDHLPGETQGPTGTDASRPG